jgi:sortase B
MKKRGWNLVAKIARGADFVLNQAISLLLVVALLYGGFGLWDTWNIYHNAGVDADLLQYKPTASGEDAPNPTLADLQKINPDVCAWLTVDDTNIDYPVVQGETNTEYLNWAVDLSFSLSGSIFLDCHNSRDFTDNFSLIYGHHMEGGLMFGQVPDFLEADFFQSHQTGTIFTLEHTYQIDWFACLETDAYDEMIYTPASYQETKSVSDLIAYLKENSTQYRDLGLTGDERLVALSTCASAATDGRVVLVGRLS